MAQLWGGRFTKETDQLVYNFNASISFDQKFYKQDIRGSIAHVTMLASVGVLTEEERDQIIDGLKGISKKFLDEKLDEIIEFSELGKFIDVPVKNYSSGMKSRLGFSVATLVEPDILILDEVLSVGDAKFRKKSEAKIMSMFDKGVTVLFVSHSLDQVKRLCNKAILLEKGKIISHGSIEEVSKVYEEKTK